MFAKTAREEFRDANQPVKTNTQVCPDSNRQLQLQQIQPVGNVDNRQAYGATSSSLTSFLHKLG